MGLNKLFTAAHIGLLLISATLTVWWEFAGNTIAVLLDIQVTALNALLEIIISCLIMYIVHESSKVRLTHNL